MSAVETPTPTLPPIENLEDGAYCVDRSRRILAWNAAAERITGYTSAEALGYRCWHNLLRHVDDRGRQLCRGWCPLVATMDDGKPREAEVYLHHKDGHRVAVWVQARPILDDEGAVVGALELFHTVAHPEAPDEAPAIPADRDPLTGLPGRETAFLRLDRWLAALRRGGRRFGIVLLRIDARERVADRFGPETYEAIVRAVAATISHAVRAGDVAARASEDTFLVLVPDASTRDIAAQAQRLRFLVEQTFLVRSHRLVRVDVQAGAAIGQPDDTPGCMIERAGS
jgi:diguanylate cyclase (GGDEF)-like protein/PAS domain S-box-containing protein